MKYPEVESSTLEFEATFPRINQIIKTIVGFCNQHGGRIIIGVENDGTIKGLSEQEIEQGLEYLHNNIYQETVPPIIPLVYAQNIADKTVLIVEVASGLNKPYYVKSEKLDKGTYIRLGRSTLRATPDIIEELKLASRGRFFDSMPVHHAELADLDMHAVQDFFHSRKGIREVPPVLNEALSAYRLITDQHGQIHPTTAGILLFGKSPQKFFSEALMRCTRYAGIEGREAIAYLDCTGTLFQQFQQAYTFLLSQLYHSFTIKGPVREERLELPEVALREAIINAIVHRNYNISATIKISVLDNRIEIFSPGGFPGPLNLQNLKKGLTYTRNVAISKVFREAGFGEKLGTGVYTIFSSYKNYGLPAPEIIEGENFVKCILPRLGAGTPHVTKNDEEELILKLFENATELTMGEMVAQLNSSRSTIARRLAALKAAGIIRTKGSGSGTRYLLEKSSDDT